MLAFPFMLKPAAEKAGIDVPPDVENFNKRKYPHWSVFVALQLGCSMCPGEHFNNAKVIALFSKKEIKRATLKDIINRGYKAC